MKLAIPQAPSSFDGSLDELYIRHARAVLLAPSVVEQFHVSLVKYLGTLDPIYLIRMNTGQVRGEIRRAESGERTKPTDNAPSWWIHARLFLDGAPSRSSFTGFIENVPCHMFEVGLKQSVNKSGWHVAHIFNVKDRELHGTASLALRMVRNLHPCNYFYIPKTDWRKYGGDESVLSFFYNKFRQRYKSVWKEFLVLAGGLPFKSSGSGSFRYTIVEAPKKLPLRFSPNLNQKSDSGDIPTYRFSRFAFKAGVIEPLRMDARFRMITPEGTFEMTKGQFYEVFPRVRETASYREEGIYHWPKTPKRAERFKIHSSIP